MAPEVILLTPSSYQPADVFAFGIIAYEILASYPFSGPPALSLLTGTALSAAELSSDVPLSADARRLLLACLHSDPGQRPLASALLGALEQRAPCSPSAS